MGRKNNINAELITEIEKEVVRKSIPDIRSKVMAILGKSKTLREFEKKANLSLKRLAEIDTLQRHKLDVKIKNWIRRNKPEWLKDYKSFPDPNPKRKRNLTDLFFYQEQKLPKFIIPLNKQFEYFVEGEHLFKYLDLSVMKKDYVDSIKTKLKKEPLIYDIVNKISFPLILLNEKKINFKNVELERLKEDRIYLYELSKNINDETKYKIIIKGISKGTFELSKLQEVKKYLFSKNNNLKKKPSVAKQIVKRIFRDLEELQGITFDKTYLLKKMYEIKKRV